MLAASLLLCASSSFGTQAEEIQANAAEALVNATRNHGEEVTARIHSLGIRPLVLMCGSENLQVTIRDFQGISTYNFCAVEG